MKSYEDLLIKKFSYGVEFQIGNRLYYPAYLDDVNLMKLALLFRTQFAGHEINFEVRVRSCANGKGLEWEIKTLSLSDDMMLLNRVYTFQLAPDWTVTSFHDHWRNGEISARCEHFPRIYKTCKTLETDIMVFLKDIKEFYIDINKDVDILEYRYLVDDSWKVILCNDERGLNYFHTLPEHLPSRN